MVISWFDHNTVNFLLFDPDGTNETDWIIRGGGGGEGIEWDKKKKMLEQAADSFGSIFPILTRPRFKRAPAFCLSKIEN